MNYRMKKSAMNLLDYIPNIEQKQKVKYPSDYIELIKSQSIGYFENDHFNIKFLGKNGLESYKWEKIKNPY
jgi:hypothetical protein